MTPDPTFPAVPDWDWLVASFPEGSSLRMGAGLDRAALHCRGRLVYLATPYSRLVTDANGNWRGDYSRYVATLTALEARRLADAGVTAISPISLACAMVHAGGAQGLDPLDQAFWTRWCRPLLNRCDVVVVPPLQGWRASDGVWHEVTEALRASKPVFVIAEAGP